ncbi:MAG: ABC transporter ATP-binding protein [Eubacterium sp.]|nr:ABC transporter ATP-binding protein [Eubacterium sp.]
MDNIVELININKHYKKQIVLDSINMNFEKGKIYGIIGPNGAGKTTIFKIISGLVKPTSGKIIYSNGTLGADIARKKISFMIENPYLESGMNAYQNMKMLAILYEVPEEKIDGLLRIVSLDPNDRKKVRNFSLGMKQRLGIAMALLKNPEMIVLDEPMNGLDPKGMIDIRNLLLNLCRKEKITIVVSSHILSELSLLADVFYLINNGTILDIISKEEIQKNNAKLEDFYLEKIEQK